MNTRNFLQQVHQKGLKGDESMEQQHSEPSKAVLGGHLESKDQRANQHGQKTQAEMLLLQMGGCSCPWNTNELIETTHYGCTMGILHCGFATHPRATTQRMGIDSSDFSVSASVPVEKGTYVCFL